MSNVIFKFVQINMKQLLFYPKLLSNTDRLLVSGSLLTLLLEYLTSHWLLWFVWEHKTYGLVEKQKYDLHCTLIWRRSQISNYVFYFTFIFFKESQLHVENSLIRDLNFKILNLSRVAGSSLTGGIALNPSARHINNCLEASQVFYLSCY